MTNDYWKKYREDNKLKICKQREEYRKNNPAKIVLTNAKANAKKRNLPFNLELEDIIVPEFCPVLGVKLIPAQGIKTDNSPSLDRLIPELGYVKGNVRVISLRANQIKSNGTIEEHERVIKYMKENGLK